MRRDHLILLAIALAYAAAVPFVRRMQVRDDDLDPDRAFMIWLLWPLATVFWIGLRLAKVPSLMFPTPQVTKVRQRLRESVAKHEEPERPLPPPNRKVP